MSTPEITGFDATRYKDTTRQQWDAAAQAWDEWGPFLREWLGPATEAMLDLAGVTAGSRVLDVAAGAGDQTLHGAGASGRAAACWRPTFAPRILELAAQNANAPAIATSATQVLDGENLDVPEASFDAVISRVGLIYFPDQQRALRA